MKGIVNERKNLTEELYLQNRQVELDYAQIQMDQLSRHMVSMAPTKPKSQTAKDLGSVLTVNSLMQIVNDLQTEMDIKKGDKSLSRLEYVNDKLGKWKRTYDKAIKDNIVDKAFLKDLNTQVRDMFSAYVSGKPFGYKQTKSQERKKDEQKDEIFKIIDALVETKRQRQSFQETYKIDDEINRLTQTLLTIDTTGVPLDEETYKTIVTPAGIIPMQIVAQNIAEIKENDQNMNEAMLDKGYEIAKRAYSNMLDEYSHNKSNYSKVAFDSDESIEGARKLEDALERAQDIIFDLFQQEPSLQHFGEINYALRELKKHTDMYDKMVQSHNFSPQIQQQRVNQQQSNIQRQETRQNTRELLERGRLAELFGIEDLYDLTGGILKKVAMPYFSQETIEEQKKTGRPIKWDEMAKIIRDKGDLQWAPMSELDKHVRDNILAMMHPGRFTRTPAPVFGPPASASKSLMLEEELQDPNRYTQAPFPSELERELHDPNRYTQAPFPSELERELQDPNRYTQAPFLSELEQQEGTRELPERARLSGLPSESDVNFEKWLEEQIPKTESASGKKRPTKAKRGGSSRYNAPLKISKEYAGPYPLPRTTAIGGRSFRVIKF